MRFGVESRLVQASSGVQRGLTVVVDPPAGHSSRAKSVIRDDTIFTPQMVTGEFYALVTTRWITRGSTREERIRDKRPAGRRLRSSSHNCADQGSIVM